MFEVRNASSLDESKRPKSRARRNITYRDAIWVDFNATRVLAWLLEGNIAREYHLNSLFRALCAWIIAPSDHLLRKQIVSFQILQDLCFIEEKMWNKKSRMMNFSILKSDPQLNFSTAYNSIGGLNTLLDTLALENPLRNGSYNASSLQIALNFLTVFHFHYFHLHGGDFSQASQLGAVRVLSACKPVEGTNFDNGRLVKQCYRDSRRSIALAYAASTIRLDNNTSLLDLMLSGNATWLSTGHYLPSLIGRARFVEEEILARVYKNEGVGVDLSSLDCEREDLPAPDPQSLMSAEIRNAFSRRLSAKDRAKLAT